MFPENLPIHRKVLHRSIFSFLNFILTVCTHKSHKTPLKICHKIVKCFFYAKNEKCITCGHPFIRSMISFNYLPLIEFQPHTSLDLSHEETVNLLKRKHSYIILCT